MQIRGTRDLKSAEDLEADVARLTAELKPALTDPGHGIEFHYCRDPDRGRAVVGHQMAGAKAATESIGLDLSALLTAQDSYLAERAAGEALHLALWTQPLVMPRVERKEAIAAAREEAASWPGRGARTAQNPFLALAGLRNRHEGFVSAVRAALQGCDIETDPLEVHDGGVVLFESLWPGEDGSGFRLSLVGDPAPMKVPRDEDPSAILWPTLGRQLAVWHPVRVTPEVARFGGRLVASVDVTLGPETPRDFGRLRDRLARAGVPFRLSMKIRSGGARQLGFSAQLAPFAALFGDDNRRLMNALERVRRLADAEGCVTWQLSLATWAEDGQLPLLQTRLAELKRCVAQWGTMQVRSLCGDPIQGALSSVLGITLESTAVTGYAPLAEVFTMIPRRAASPWERGSVPFLTPDGALWPYEEGSDVLPYSFTLIFSRMGGGKSALIARLALGNILAGGADRLPFLAVLDVGFSSGGFIETLRESLPSSRRSDVAHAKLRMDPHHVINILDTPLGCRYPPPDQQALIEEAFLVLALSPEAREGHEGMGALIGRMVVEVYRYRDDANPDGAPNIYAPGFDPEIDAAIAHHRLETTLAGGKQVTWWRIVDSLFMAGAIAAAGRAQRYAVPVAGDLLITITLPAVRADFEGYITKGGQPLTTVVQNGLKSALSQYPICDGTTRFEPTARVIALDLQDVIGRGTSAAAGKQTAVVYTWCLVALTRRWWLEPRDVAANPAIPDRYRAFHIKAAEDLAQTPKVLVADEFHETANSAATRAAIVKMVRKGRKYRIRVILASQMLDDFDPEMRQLASVLIALSADDEAVVRTMAELFGLRDAHCQALRKLGRRDPRLGVPLFLLVKSKRGVFSQLVYNAMCPRELWAVATNPREVTLRRLLTGRVGFARAVALLAAFEPFRTRSAEEEIEIRIRRHLEEGDLVNAEERMVITALVDEMVAIDRQSLLKRLEAP